MNSQQSVIEELEETLSHRAIGYRADALRRVTDLFLSAPAAYSDREIVLFDEVMIRLTEDIETSVRAALARRLAMIPNAPQNLIRKLAADCDIGVAGPILRESPRLDDDTLVANAQSASQDHLFAISQRQSISEAVTDVLVERGDRRVALSTVNNTGARFSANGQAVLIERSKDDDELAIGVWSRQDIPHDRLLKLFTIASENVRRSLEAVNRHQTNLIRDMVVDVSNQIQAQIREQSSDCLEAQESVTELNDAGKLDDERLREFAAAGKFSETTMALSILCDLPIGACERALVQTRADVLLLIAKAIDLSWETTKAILQMRVAPASLTMQERDEMQASFLRLRPETAKKALHFLRLRERASISKTEQLRH